MNRFLPQELKPKPSNVVGVGDFFGAPGHEQVLRFYSHTKFMPGVGGLSDFSYMVASSY